MSLGVIAGGCFFTLSTPTEFVRSCPGYYSFAQTASLLSRAGDGVVGLGWLFFVERQLESRGLGVWVFWQGSLIQRTITSIWNSDGYGYCT